MPSQICTGPGMHYKRMQAVLWISLCSLIMAIVVSVTGAVGVREI